MVVDAAGISVKECAQYPGRSVDCLLADIHPPWSFVCQLTVTQRRFGNTLGVAGHAGTVAYLTPEWWPMMTGIRSCKGESLEFRW